MRKGWQDQGVGAEGSVQTENIMCRESLRWQESRCAGGTERSAWLERAKREEGGKRPWARRGDIQEFDRGGLGAGVLTCWEEGQALSEGHVPEMRVPLA